MVKINKIINMMVHRYKTADPFVIADKLNIQVEWCNFGKFPLGKIIYDQHCPIVMLNNSIKHTPLQYFTLGHELGHVVLHEDLTGYYTTARHGHSKLETEADEFSVALMGMLFIEENDCIPYSYDELACHYGVPSAE